MSKKIIKAYDDTVPAVEFPQEYIQSLIYAVGDTKDSEQTGIEMPGFIECTESTQTIGNASSGADFAGSIYADLFEVMKTKTEYGNLGTESFSGGDTVNLPTWTNKIGSTYLYSSASLTGSDDDPMPFSSQESGGDLGNFNGSYQLALSAGCIYRFNFGSYFDYIAAGQETILRMYNITDTSYFSARTRSYDTSIAGSRSELSNAASLLDCRAEGKTIALQFETFAPSGYDSVDAFLQIENTFATGKYKYIKY